MNWNLKKGKCAEKVAKCMFGRVHTCIVCGKGHRALDGHKQAEADKFLADRGLKVPGDRPAKR